VGVGIRKITLPLFSCATKSGGASVQLAGASFVDVAQAKSFSAVARRKGLVASSVARQIDALEQDLNVPLFTRSTRALVMTEAGALLFERAVKILHDMTDARSEVVSLDGSVQGLLRVSCVPAFGRRHVVPHLASLFDKHPALSVEMELTDDTWPVKSCCRSPHAEATPDDDLPHRSVSQRDGGDSVRVSISTTRRSLRSRRAVLWAASSRSYATTTRIRRSIT